MARVLARTLPLLLVSLVTTPAVAGEPLLGIAWDPSGIGLVLPGGLWLSGDVTLAADVPETQSASGEIDDLRLLARYEPFSRLAFFTELRLEDVVDVVEGEGLHAGGVFVVERLYAEALLTPQLSLRVGKVYTPFGLWNVISRAPLTWTVEEPAVAETDEMFPGRATGLSLLYQKTWRGWSIDATAYGPAQNEITVHQPHGSGLLFGTRVAAGREIGPTFAALGLNAAGFRSWDRADWTTASGLDLEVHVAGQEITGELTYRVPTAGGRNENGLYLQDAIPLFGDLYGVLRFEYFHPRRGRPALGQVVGLFWRPLPNVVLKTDYLFGTRRLENLEPGFQASVSLLF